MEQVALCVPKPWLRSLQKLLRRETHDEGAMLSVILPISSKTFGSPDDSAFRES